ncbi:mediator of RNA polymerase II transcription subunit 15 isoform X2 [Drosophila hydei]|uniref:Mediator of RNA polymerase II transcription subunit 15 isoform X2 n=1 Tax=Drosophila hydei TaxID=7224 RepID=A0A6J2T030_DROHY|nr:mediator of RNA polymerase II transcription subunit 15 isoform X2 [Drosophila hydei]
MQKETQREKLRELLKKQEQQLLEQVELLREQQKEKLKTEQEERLRTEQEEKLKMQQKEQLRTEQEEKLKECLNDQLTATPICPHEPGETQQVGSWCAVCGECRESPHGWGKLNKADQWRLDNLQNESLANYKSTYEIRSPYISRQISWEETQQPQQQQQQQQPREQLHRQRSEVEIVTTPAAAGVEGEAATATVAPTQPKDWQLSRSPSPLPLRKYPAPLIDTAQRCSSPFGLNAVQLKSSTPTPREAKYTHVPQLEGHNIGLLVHTATEPLQQCMCASSSMLAGTPPATPRCNSQPPPFEFLMQHGLGLDAQREAHLGFKSLAGSSEELPRERSVNRSFDNVSPRPYIGIEGYKRVAWPPASEERIVREFTPQPQTQSPAPGSGGYYPQPAASQPSSANAAPAQQPAQQQYGAPSYNNYQQQQQQQPAPQQWQQQQQQQQYQAPYQTSPYQQAQQPNYPQQNGGANYAQPQYNSYSQPQQQQQQQQPLQQQPQQQQLPYSLDQTDQQHGYRGASPGIITLRKEAPVSQKPAPVYTSQPAAVSYQGGSKLRGDLKWPPQEYKEAAVRENEERRLLALGPVCRPRRVNRDYTPFFAKHQLNNTYPSYKVPPGTQHMFGI